jgi:hypothetical protein
MRFNYPFDIGPAMDIVFVVLALLVPLLIAYYLFRSRVTTSAASAGDLPAAEPLPASPGLALVGEDMEATRVFHRNALKAPQAREGGINVKDRQPRLIGISKEVRGVVIPLVPTGAIIGRAADNQIRVTDPRVSQRHVWVGVVHDIAMVCDLNSTNGTFLNTETDAPITEADLKPNDTILLGGHGGTQFRFVID